GTVLDRSQQLRVDSRQSCQGLSVETIIFSAALRDQFHLPWIGHDQFMPKALQQAAHPRRMSANFHGDAGPPETAKCLGHPGFGCRHLTFAEDLSLAAQQAVTTCSVSQIHPNRDSLFGFHRSLLTLL